MTVLDDLIAARNLIEKPENWTQGEWARRADGRYVEIDSPDAMCWRGMGALLLVGGCSELFDVLSDVMGGSITEFNDNHTHAEVLAAFDRAIEAERAKEQCE